VEFWLPEGQFSHQLQVDVLCQFNHEHMSVGFDNQYFAAAGESFGWIGRFCRHVEAAFADRVAHFAQAPIGYWRVNLGNAADGFFFSRQTRRMQSADHVGHGALQCFGGDDAHCNCRQQGEVAEPGCVVPGDKSNRAEKAGEKRHAHRAENTYECEENAIVAGSHNWIDSCMSFVIGVAVLISMAGDTTIGVPTAMTVGLSAAMTIGAGVPAVSTKMPGMRAVDVETVSAVGAFGYPAGQAVRAVADSVADSVAYSVANSMTIGATNVTTDAILSYVAAVMPSSVVVDLPEGKAGNNKAPT